MKSMNESKETVECASELLRGEISAIETYDQVIDKLKGSSKVSDLKIFRQDHFNAREIISQFVTSEVDAAGSGAWGEWAKLVTGAAKILGDKPALKALKEGEEHGMKEYQAAIKKDGIDLELKRMIESKLLPQQYKHIQKLDQLLDQ
jgi:hypothetical protein